MTTVVSWTRVVNLIHIKNLKQTKTIPCFICFRTFPGVHGEFRGPVSSFDWRVDGSEIAAIDQQSGLFVLDPRKASNKPAAALETRLTPSKENHVVWLADSGNGKVLVSGFNKVRYFKGLRNSEAVGENFLEVFNFHVIFRSDHPIHGKKLEHVNFNFQVLNFIQF